MATWIVGLVIVGAIFFALKYVLRTAKQDGCGNSEECCHCKMEKKSEINLKS
ncbi:MAG: FeoB-associated Cys-rich membrane protein [Phascolarctobacterium sp.]|nr:FeoB-associated Cys-rich membrane protein [Phascolarctobacterium sp.]